MAKVTVIELIVEDYRREFPVEQADELLRIKRNGGSKLPEDREWSWTPEKGFEKKAAGKGAKKPTESASTVEE
jgi:hypothetical protein